MLNSFQHPCTHLYATITRHRAVMLNLFQHLCTHLSATITRDRADTIAVTLSVMLNLFQHLCTMPSTPSDRNPEIERDPGSSPG